jgi:16S rRNA (guanine(966)-N(2))-methyltransferase RsmD
MVRQAVFNMLRHDLEGALFHDVFAGTGVVGIEALSRGAARTVFVERDHRQIQLIRRNLERLEIGRDRAAVRQSDAHLWATHSLFDEGRNIVFLGPPYPLFDEPSDRIRILSLPAKLQDRLGPNDRLVFQFSERVEFDKLPDPDRWYRQRHYGKTKVAFWSPTPPDTEDIGDDPVDDSTAADLGPDDDGAAIEPGRSLPPAGSNP